MTSRTRERGTVLGVATWTWATDLVVAGIWALLGWVWLVQGFEPGAWAGWAYFGAAGLTAARALWLATLRVHLTADAVVVRGLRGRTIARGDVQAVTERRRFWLTNRVVEITGGDGVPVTAMARASWLDRSFEENRRFLERWWRNRPQP